MKRLFTFIKQLFTKKSDETLHNMWTDVIIDVETGQRTVTIHHCDEPLHNHHDGCPSCYQESR